MKSCSLIGGIIVVCLAFTLCRCTPPEIDLPGDVTGMVTDAETHEPLDHAVIRVIYSDDSTITDSNGSFLLKNLPEGNKEFQASKKAYEKVSKAVRVQKAETVKVDFALKGTGYPVISDTYLDFGFDRTARSFSISNEGKKSFNYTISASQDWITVNPVIGNVSTETDTIYVTIDRTGLPDTKITEEINILTYIGAGTRQFQIDVFLNGAPD